MAWVNKSDGISIMAMEMITNIAISKSPRFNPCINNETGATINIHKGPVFSTPPVNIR